MKTNYLTTILVLVAISLLPAQSYAKKSAGAVVLDANDNQVGVLFDAKKTEAAVMLEKDGNVWLLGVRKDGFKQLSSPYVYLTYTQAGCLGTPMLLDFSGEAFESMITPLVIRDNQGYFESEISLPDTEFISSTWTDEEECVPIDPPIPVAGKDIKKGSFIDLSVFTPPFRYGTAP